MFGPTTFDQWMDQYRMWLSVYVESEDLPLPEYPTEPADDVDEFGFTVVGGPRHDGSGRR